MTWPIKFSSACYYRLCCKYTVQTKSDDHLIIYMTYKYTWNKVVLSEFYGKICTVKDPSPYWDGVACVLVTAGGQSPCS